MRHRGFPERVGCALTVLLLPLLAILAVVRADGAVVAPAADGRVVVVVGDRAVTIDAELAARISAAVADNADDAEALAAAVAQIVRSSATGAANETLATAILLFSVSLSDRAAETIEAIVAGVATGSGAVAAATLVEALADASDPPAADAEEEAANPAATAENPHQVSAVG